MLELRACSHSAAARISAEQTKSDAAPLERLINAHSDGVCLLMDTRNNWRLPIQTVLGAARARSSGTPRSADTVLAMPEGDCA